MRRNGVLLPRADADRMKQIRTEIGRRLKEHYDVGKHPMSDRLAEVVRKIEN